MGRPTICAPLCPFLIFLSLARLDAVVTPSPEASVARAEARANDKTGRVCRDAAADTEDRVSTCSITLYVFAQQDKSSFLSQVVGTWDLKDPSYTMVFPELLSAEGKLSHYELDCVCPAGFDCAVQHATTNFELFTSHGQARVSTVSLAPPAYDSIAVAPCTVDRCRVLVNLDTSVTLSPGSAILRCGPDPPAAADSWYAHPRAVCHTNWEVTNVASHPTVLHLATPWAPAIARKTCISMDRLALTNSKLVSWECVCSDMSCSVQMAEASLQIYTVDPSDNSDSNLCSLSKSLHFSPLALKCSDTSCSAPRSECAHLDEAAKHAVGMKLCFESAVLDPKADADGDGTADMSPIMLVLAILLITVLLVLCVFICRTMRQRRKNMRDVASTASEEDIVHEANRRRGTKNRKFSNNDSSEEDAESLSGPTTGRDSGTSSSND